jgi:hypothetical protein
MKFDKLTEEQLEMLKDPFLTLSELSDKLQCGTATLHRWRKSLGIVIGRGSKKGKPRPWQEKKENRTCPECQEVFQTTPAATKIYCSLGCSTKNIDRSYMQSESYRSSLMKDETPEYRKYSGRVHRLTAKIYESAKYIINPNDYPRGLAGQDGVYHLDHIVSIRYGFDNNIPPEDIAKVENLQMLPWKENISKGK